MSGQATVFSSEIFENYMWAGNLFDIS